MLFHKIVTDSKYNAIHPCCHSSNLVNFHMNGVDIHRPRGVTVVTPTAYESISHKHTNFLINVKFSQSFIYQACPVDLTRTIASSTPNTDKSTCRKLAFSVENILDPNKFCSRKENQESTHLWLNGSFERDDRHRLDDDQSESQSGKLLTTLF